MTPTRAKRNSKVPNRFSSDNARIETSNTNGETIIDYNDKTTSTTNNLVPISRSIKFKPAIREPLKVKLPKLKRPDYAQQPQQQQKQKQTKDGALQSNTSEIKIHKIKLPSFKKVNKDHSNQSDTSKGKTPVLKIALNRPTGPPNKQQDETLTQKNDPEVAAIIPSPSWQSNEESSSQNSNTKSSIAHNQMDCSTSSKSSHEEDEQVNADSSFSSDQSSSGPMQMIVCPSEPVQESSSGIRCPCGVDDDLGVMVECEKCSNWQHGHCINVGTEEEAYEGYVCAYCSNPENRFRESLHQLTVNDKFYSQFKLLESLKKKQDKMIANVNGTEENNARLTLQELYQATKDLNRVMGSLKVKWRLFELATQGVCEQELILWQNPYWTEEQLKNASDDTSYIWARCRNNLELNIRNMISKMEVRLELIHYGVLLAKGTDQTTSCNNDGQRDDGAIRQSLEVLTYGLRDFKNKLKDLKG